MDDTTLRVTTKSSAGGALELVVEGYLDEEGGTTLVKQSETARATHHRRVFIDLGAVTLFTCSGVRRLIAVINGLNQYGCQVDLRGVHYPLQRLLDLAA
jgi:anti-anti-sigma regulatory factor